MKKYIHIIGFLFFTLHFSAQVGVTNNSADTNAALDLNPGGVTTNTQGLHLPVVKLDATNLTTPLTSHTSGMLVYNTATNGAIPNQVTPGIYCNDGTQWKRVFGTTDLWGLSGNYGITAASNFIGTTDAVDFATRTNNTERMRITAAGKTLIGTTTVPTGGNNSKLIINSSTAGALQIKDGTEGLNKVFTADANGVGKWAAQASSNVVVKTLTSSTGIEIPPTLTTGQYLYTGNSITLGPGKWLVSANIILTKITSVTAANESWWVRSTFSDSNTTLAISPDISGTTLISGTLPPKAGYSLLTGSIIINNTSGANKTYYYIAGDVNVSNPTTPNIQQFASSFYTENYIMTQKIQ